MNSGILLLDKEKGLTSREVDNAIGKLFPTSHVGHLGTLDPFATGLLIIGLGKGTKCLPYIDDSQKSYEASLFLGATTSTLDPTSGIVGEAPVPPLTGEAIQKALDSFLGVSEQIPPMTSALKVDGEPLYRKAHRGEVVERQPRKIEIFALRLLSYEPPLLRFACVVSRGTYVRVLGASIAEKLGTIGYLTELRRLSIGAIKVSEAKKMGTLTESDIARPLPFLDAYPHYAIADSQKADVLNGVPLRLDRDYGEKIILTLQEEALACYYRLQGTTYASERGLF
jgi:tRNA pseudouridine55 synthase